MNLFKKAVILVASLAFATTAFAATLNTDSQDRYVFRTTNISGTNGSANNWSRSTTIAEGQLLSFAMYYHAVGGTLQDVRFKMDNLNNREYSDGQTITVGGTVSASNAANSSGTSQVTFTDDVELRIYNVSWQPNQCTSVTCERSLPGGQNSSNVLTSGITIGDVAAGWPTQGSVVVTFKAYSTSTSNYDNCTINGITVLHGESKRFYSQTTVPSGQVCSAYDQVRSCYDGVLSGSDTYRYATCTVDGNSDGDVTTNSATSIDEDSARLNGEWDGDDNTEVWFAFDENDSTPSCTSSSQRVGTQIVDDGDSFYKVVSSLDEDETYYFRACADDNGDILSGSIRSFTTDEDDNGGDGDVTTNSATSIDEDSARLNGEWDGDDNTEVWFAFDENDSTPSCTSSSQRTGVQDVDDGDDFSKTIYGLDEDEKYYFRACADDNGDILSGSIRSFTTDEDDNGGDDLEVTTNAATSIDEDSARLNGEIDGEDDVEVWFAFSRTDSTPSCSASSQRIDVSGSYDDGDDFSKVVSGLLDDTRYYFRACAENGSLESGSVRSFTTDSDSGGTTQVTAQVVTNVASGITTSSARLNSIVLGKGNAVCYFQYGRTSSLGLTSPRVSIDLDNTSSCSSTRTGLSSNSTYYFRGVIEQSGQTAYGSTRTFQTNRTVTNTNPRPTDGNTTITIINQNETTGFADELDITKFVSAETDPRFDIQTQATPGETVYYKVKVTNNTDEDLDDVVIIDRIPYYLELDDESALDDDNEKQIRWVTDIKRGETQTYITEMRVREDARIGDTIESYATATTDDYSVNSNDVYIDVDNSFFGDEDEFGNQTGTIFGAGFFPDTLVGWGLLLLLILAIAYFISRIIVARNENAKVIAELKQAQATRANG